MDERLVNEWTMITWARGKISFFRRDAAVCRWYRPSVDGRAIFNNAFEDAADKGIGERQPATSARRVGDYEGSVEVLLAKNVSTTRAVAVRLVHATAG